MALFNRFSSILNTNESNPLHPEDIPFVLPTRRKYSLTSKKNNEQKSLLESLNLELYASSEGDEYVFGENHIGRLWFELEYDSDRQRISVCVGKVRNLPNHNYGKESIFVSLSPDHFDERSLKFVIYRVDTLMRALPFGQVIFPLKDYTIKRKKRVTFWRDFERNVTDIPIVTSEIHCSLVYYENLQRLTLTVMEANDLNLTGNNESWGVFLKVELCLGARKLKTKKSQVVKKTRSPVFNQSFSFSISPERIDEASIHIQLYQTKPYKLVGRLILGGYMFTRDKPLQHWQEMLANMKTAKRHSLHDQNETTLPYCHCPKHLQGHTSSWRPVKYKKPPGSGPILKA
ncbi:Synaptotagmin-15 [Trichinella pseudospiralis]|uniref:Synaptotagmin-15 n=1 Tax=Trichinella pseudospiralis TaxID=6337 RepID=A0A0V1IM07_TRIPS|nr:Synaptotagmin-15 [Trichinella pseudospiralis]KRZ40475.1 Synaptotagmin-15 [Trichinella pseudospiralis]